MDFVPSSDHTLCGRRGLNGIRAPWMGIAAISISLAILLALRAWFIRWMTEIVVTDRRVIYAHGFIQRHSVEVHMDKIESLDVDQGMLGRVFDYGDVTIRGTGTTMEPLHDVDRPIAFRNEVPRDSKRGWRVVSL